MARCQKFFWFSIEAQTAGVIFGKEPAERWG